MNRTLKRASVLLICALALLLGGLFAWKTTAGAEGISIEEARTSAASDLVAAEPVTVSGNFREGAEHSVTYENGTFRGTTGGNWERSAKRLSNSYLDAERVIKNGEEVPTSEVTSYFTAKFEYSHSEDSRTAGILFGKRAVDGNTRYYGLVISPTQKVVFVYTFDVAPEGNVVKEAQGPLSLDPKDYAENTAYTIEILMKPNAGIDVYVGGQAIVTGCVEVNETHESLVGLTPVVGLSWCDITATVSELTLRYLDAKFPIELARSSQSANLVGSGETTVSANLREEWEHTVQYENGVFTATTSGSAIARSAKLLQNDYLDSERAQKNGAEVATSELTSYFKATFQYSQSPQDTTVGILFGKRAVESNTRYYALVVSPTQKVVFVYTFDVDGEGKFVTNAQGPLSYEQRDYPANTDHTIELLMRPNAGIDVYVSGQRIVTGCVEVNETHESLVGLTPVIGLSWFDISATVKDFSLQYLDGEVIPTRLPPDPDAEAIEAARNSEADNLVAAEAVTVSANLREEWEHTVQYENGVFTATTSGSAISRSAKLLQNRYLSSERAQKDGTEVATSELTSYFKATFQYTVSPQYTTVGILFGKRAVESNTRYYALVVSPTQQVVFVYTFDLGPEGNAVAEAQGPLSYDTKDYPANTDHTIELLMKPGVGIDVYVSGQKIVANCGEVTTSNMGSESNESLVGLTPVIGLSWFDISATVKDFSLQYLDGEVIPAEIPKPPADLNEFTLEGARASEAENVAAMGTVTASDNFRYKENYGIRFEDGKFTAGEAGTGDARAAMRLTSGALNSELVEKDGQEVLSAQANYYISVDVTITAAAQDKTIGTLIGKRENERSITWYAAVVSYSQKYMFIYAFETDMSGNVLSENQGEISAPITVELGQKYTLEVLVSPVYGITAAWNGEQVCRNLTEVMLYPVTQKDSMLSLTPVIGLSWFDMAGTAENFVLKYLDAEVVPEEDPEPPHTEHTDGDNDGRCDICGEPMPKDPDDPDDPDNPDNPDNPDKPDDPVGPDDPDDPDNPDDPDDPGINTDPIVPDVDRPEESGCGGIMGAAVLPVLLLAVLISVKRRKE